jgi:hypothetical protein
MDSSGPQLDKKVYSEGDEHVDKEYRQTAQKNERKNTQIIITVHALKNTEREAHVNAEELLQTGNNGGQAVFVLRATLGPPLHTGQSNSVSAGNVVT